MIQTTNKSKCSGCHACYNTCPKNCIEMKKDIEGFIYPVVDLDLCIKCGICEKVCQSINPILPVSTPIAYACYNKNDEIRKQSSSGGVFTLIAEWLINQGGAVFGAAFDDDFSVHHICIENTTDLYKLRGSKYLQSIIGDTYQQTKNKLDNGQLVLFTGTPCQIDGLLHYLKKEYDNLFTIDIACHGVPSPLVWQKYLIEKEKKIKKISFRCKDTGWKNYSISIAYENGDIYKEYFGKDPYMLSFLLNYSLRPSCYQCRFKGIERQSDITLADFWGIQDVMPHMDDDKGTSLVLIHSKQGRRLFEYIHSKIIADHVEVGEAVSKNLALMQSAVMSNQRKKFFSVLNDKGFAKAFFAASHVPIVKRVLLKTLRMLLSRGMRFFGE